MANKHRELLRVTKKCLNNVNVLYLKDPNMDHYVLRFRGYQSHVI